MSMVEHNHYTGGRHGLNLVPLGQDATSTCVLHAMPLDDAMT